MTTSSHDRAVGSTHLDRQSERLLEATPDAVVIIEGSGAIVQINSKVERLFGYSREELMGRPIESLMPERFRRSHAPRREAYASNPESRPMGRGLDLLGLRKDGSEFPIDVSLSPMPTETGTVIISAIRDVSAQRRLEDDLRRRTRELEEADRQKDQLLSAVAHELRSPLAVLSNVAHLLQSPDAGPAVHQRGAEVLGRQTAHMACLVEDLLDLSLVRRGEVRLRREPVDLRTVIPRAVEMVQPLIETRKQHLEAAECRDPLRVNGDLNRLVRIVSNLLTNAAKYTPEGGHIWLSVGREDGSVVVRIRDDGMGIPREMLSRVFDLFTQVEAAGRDSTGGLGIGLALVRQLVELHGGTVEVTSEGPGRGSEFVVRLPLLAEGLKAAEAGGASG